MITEVDAGSLPIAARVHAESWRASHRSFCSAEFVALHTPERQAAYLQSELDTGKRLFLLCAPEPVGLVSVCGSLVENLYVLPREQRKGYGTRLLQFAMQHCTGVPTLWVLSNNRAAIQLYEKHGFRATGNQKTLRDDLFELEMRNL